MRFSKTFEMQGNIDRVFALTQEFFSEVGYRLEHRVKPQLLLFNRGDIAGSLFDFNIQKVRTQLTISFSQRSEDVQVHCVYETRYGRLITSRDRAVFENEVDKLKHYLTDSPKER